MKWIHPLKDGPRYPTPIPGDPGGFSTARKFDHHTGVDLYASEGDQVVAVEDGRVIGIECFTGPDAGYPWWYPTEAVLVRGASGVVVYGEIDPLVFVGQLIRAGSPIGKVRRVLRRNKGKTPTSMLHLELLTPESRKTSLWHLGTPKPDCLLDPTPHLLRAWC